MQFTDTSTGAPTSWAWTFGDGGTSTSQSPSHPYAAGTFTATLTASNANGSTSASKTITVSSAPVAPRAATSSRSPALTITEMRLPSLVTAGLSLTAAYSALRLRPATSRVSNASCTAGVGRAKAAGKTTFLMHLVRAVLEGRPFLGRRTEPTPVVILTAFSQRDLVERAREAGAMAYLVKPFAKHDLVPAIELAVSRFAEFAALETEVATLTDRMETRKLVERAKGLLMSKQGLSEPEAFRWIQRTAMDRRATMRDVAQAVVENIT